MFPVPVPLPESASVNFSGLVTPRIVKSPSTSNVSGPVCTTFFDRNVINGLCFTSKKSLLFSLPSFMPLPVFTLSAWILTSKTAVVTSGDVNVRVASHLSKVQSIATDAFTKNLIELSSGVTTDTGTCALPSDGRAIDATSQKTFNPPVTPLNPIVDTRYLVSLAQIPRLRVATAISAAHNRFAKLKPLENRKIAVRRRQRGSTILQKNVRTSLAVSTRVSAD